jgi:predicted unusual protein kinase regulating ubiquinone biosynthesis (AarF/ABC1/UbiB family)
MEHIIGKKINELDEEDYFKFAKQIVKFGLVTSLIHGVAHGDFHVGNILFIKEDSKIETEKERYKYKLGVIDFGIVNEINEPLKSNLLKCLTSVFQEPPTVFLDKFANSGIFEPYNVKDIVPEKIYNTIINLNVTLVEELLYSKKLKNFHLYEIVKILFVKLNSSENDIYNISKYGIKPSKAIIKLQLSLAMANGVTFALCQDKTLQITNEVINELFHTNLFMDE